MFLTHTQGTIDEILGVYLDDEGSLLLLTNRGIGVVDDRDLEGLSTYLRLDGGDADAGRIKAAIDDVQAGKRSQLVIEWGGQALKINPLVRAAVASRFGFKSDPKKVEKKSM